MTRAVNCKIVGRKSRYQFCILQRQIKAEETRKQNYQTIYMPIHVYSSIKVTEPSST